MHEPDAARPTVPLTASPQGAIVVVNYGASALLEANLTPEAVAASGCLVVVTDNFSCPAERAAITALCAARGWHLVPRDGNDGFGAGVNRGVEAALALGADVFVALNPDAVADGAVLAELVDQVRSAPDALVAPLITTSQGGSFFRGAQVSMRTGRIRTGWSDDDADPEWRNWLTGACLAYSARVHRALGGMTEDYFLYWEDVDFSRRAADFGFRLVLRRDLTIVHDEGGTHGVRPERAKSPLYYFYNTRNRLLFGSRLAPRARRSFLAATPAESRRIFLRGGRRQLLTQPAGLVSAVRGSLAGVGLALRRRTPAPARSGGVLVAHPSPDLYGSDRVLLESVTGMIDAGERVVVVLPTTGPLVAELEARGAEVVLCPAPVLRKSALSPAGMIALVRETLVALPRAVRLIGKVAPEVVFVNTITNAVWLAAARLAGRRVVCHVHEAERSARPLVRKGLYAPLLLADHLVVNSRFALGVLTDTWPVLAGRADIVANGVPGPAHPSPPRGELDEARVLFIGRLSPRKGPQVAVRAVRRLLDEGRRVHLSLLGAVFPGYEWFEAELIELVEQLGLTDQVTFLGFHPDIWSHLAAADIICVPSTVDEPFGNTAVEAMLARRPLVVSDTSGLREAAADYATARRVRPDDDAALAAAIADLTDHWAEVVGHTEADRELALSRHAPEVYRRTLVDTITDRRAARRGRSTPR